MLYAGGLGQPAPALLSVWVRVGLTGPRVSAAPQFWGGFHVLLLVTHTTSLWLLFSGNHRVLSPKPMQKRALQENKSFLNVKWNNPEPLLPFLWEAGSSDLNVGQSLSCLALQTSTGNRCLILHLATKLEQHQHLHCHPVSQMERAWFQSLQ